MRLRFAPSPTGYLHVGNARTALFNWLAARGANGTMVLRIEDTDTERSTREFEEGILEDLRWLGITWDEGPDLGGPFGPYRQSERLDTYKAYTDELLGRGAAYRCFCSFAQLEANRRAAVAAGRPTCYPGTCRTLTAKVVQRRLDAGEPAAIRFAVPEVDQVEFDDLVRGTVSFSGEIIGDPIIMRSDGRPAYNFAAVVDDALMKISHVVRGEDHISNTPRQLLLYEALGFAQPCFAHLALVMGPDRAPLSKRHGATSVEELRRCGYLPEALTNYLALIGWSPGGDEEILPIEELARRFRIADVSRSSGIFDPEKLGWLNRHDLKALSAERLATLVVPFFKQAGFAIDPDGDGAAFLKYIAALAVGAVDRLEQIPERLKFLFEFDVPGALANPEIRHEVSQPEARRVITALTDELANRSRLDIEGFRELKTTLRNETDCRGRKLFPPIRIVLTGHSDGMELDSAVPAIDRGAELPSTSGLSSIVGCRERAAAFATALGLS